MCVDPTFRKASAEASHEGGAWLTPESAHSPQVEICHIVEPPPSKPSPSRDEDVADLIEGAHPATLAVNHIRAGSPQIVISAPKPDDNGGIATSTPSELINEARIRKRTTGRPDTPSSMHSLQKASRDGNWLQTFLRILFVDWIGGFISRLCGSRRKA